MTTEAVLGKDMRMTLLNALRLRKNEIGNNFSGKLRDSFERAIIDESDMLIHEMSSDVATDTIG